MFTYYRRSLIERKSPFDWTQQPKSYTLGGGHAMFFYDKMKYVERRWQDVRCECQNRGFTTNIQSLEYSTKVNPTHMNDWTPDKSAMKVNVERIVQRIQKKPQWYKYYGKPIDSEFMSRYQHLKESNVNMD